MQIANSDKLVYFYILDVIISVGYRVKSQNEIIFRKWANKILKDYLLKGYAVNEKRLKYLEKKVQLLDITNRGIDNLSGNEVKDILKVINEYTNALDLLDGYDHHKLAKIKGLKDDLIVTYND